MIRYFESYEILFLLLGLSCIQLFLKGVSYLLFQRLIWEAERLGKTEEHWFRAMKTKFEAYYKLKLGVHNVVNFVEHYLYQYKYLGVSLQTWENIGLYLMVVHIVLSGILCLMGGYYGMNGIWFYITGCASLILLCIQGAAELLLNTHRSYCVLRVVLIDYMENTMRARLENSSFHQDAMREYQMEYFRPVSDQKDAKAESDAFEPEMHQVEPEPLYARSEQVELEDHLPGSNQAQSESNQTGPETEKLLAMLAATKEDDGQETKSEKEKLFEQILSDYM